MSLIPLLHYIEYERLLEGVEGNNISSKNWHNFHLCILITTLVFLSCAFPFPSLAEFLNINTNSKYTNKNNWTKTNVQKGKMCMALHQCRDGHNSIPHYFAVIVSLSSAIDNIASNKIFDKYYIYNKIIINHVHQKNSGIKKIKPN